LGFGEKLASWRKKPKSKVNASTVELAEGAVTPDELEQAISAQNGHKTP